MFVLMSSVLVTKTCSDLRLAHPCIITFEKKGTAVIHRHLKKLDNFRIFPDYTSHRRMSYRSRIVKSIFA